MTLRLANDARTCIEYLTQCQWRHNYSGVTKKIPLWKIVIFIVIILPYGSN